LFRSGALWYNKSSRNDGTRPVIFKIERIDIPGKFFSPFIPNVHRWAGA
jgi:hypothetical protein